MNLLRISLYVGRQAQTMTVLRCILLQIFALLIDTKKELENHVDEKVTITHVVRCGFIRECYTKNPGEHYTETVSATFISVQVNHENSTFLPKGK